ncbi:fibronectin type III domain-containing protein [Spirosoma pollinicola]|uniref:Fibronectin type-III domain-containing protein n=1 Tax=Spirosoma pollinicola TaxID=2057025 RepID=A0A2K8YXE4_9BACT|nr:fibronectin type III domain-containing protein [Spirosoma pollinicola]AUD02307.1 hypothetical protein CWM47_11005 [Spirosoma pollinicola]
MRTSRTNTLVILFLSMALHQLSVGQSTPQSTSLACGTVDLTPAQTTFLVQEANLALQRKRASNAAFTAITYVPIRPHIIRQSDGTGGFSLVSLNHVLAATNKYYLLNGFGIQFSFAGTTPDYIDNDDMYEQYGSQSVDAYDAHDALNQYYVNRFQNPSLGGYASYPNNSINSTRSFILTGSKSEDDLGNRLIPHELGHTFGLIHTFGQNSGTGILGTGVTNELVTRGAGANCATEGDLICDTPADPYNMGDANLYSVNGCPQYDPASTARDAHGDAYTPSITNIMSYYFPCTHDFTPGQYDRMQAGLALRQTHTAYTLDAPATNVNPVSHLAATSNGGAVLLTWQDNATNEMGYFIERSTSPTTNFVPIGGTGPDELRFIDNQTTPLTQYYYRIRPSNTKTGSISSTASFVIPIVPPVTGLMTTELTGNSARLSWNSLGEGTRYDVQWRQVGAANWILITGINETYTSISLSGNTAYEWEVRGIGSVAYSGPINFLTPCSTPTNPVSYPARITAALSWNGTINELYTLQWRTIGATAWNTISGLTSTTTLFGITGSYSLTGLASQTPYEWQVQGVCPGSPTVNSDFTPLRSFTTEACPSPYTTVSNPGAESVTIYFSTGNIEPGIYAELRYRPQGAPDWHTVSGLPNVLYGGGSYTVTGLTTNTTYEWQLKNVCGALESSTYTYLSTFLTTCRIPNGLTNTTTSTGATLQWSVSSSPDPATAFTLQYRPVGRPGWTTVARNTPSCSLTGLTAGTTYEWHVLTNCTANVQSGYSITKTFTTGCNQLVANNLRSLLVTSSSARLVWTVVNDPGVQYYISYRAAGAANWTEINAIPASLTGGYCNLTGLTNNTTYEWLIAPLCPDQPGHYIAGPTFTTQCQIPLIPYTNVKITSASLYWNEMGIDVRYEVRYRLSGTLDWTTIGNLLTNTCSLTGLTGNTRYEWQVRTKCALGDYTDFTSLVQFTTYSCSLPGFGSPPTTNVTTTSATLNWTYFDGDASTRYAIRYREVGSTTWTILTNLLGTPISSTLILNGLTPGTTYEWQIRTICSATESSAFTISTIFQTRTPCSSMYTIQSGTWNDPTIWSCNRVPVSTDIVLIKHIILVPVSYIANARQINVDTGQKLSFGTNAQLKLGL